MLKSFFVLKVIVFNIFLCVPEEYIYNHNSSVNRYELRNEILHLCMQISIK